MSILDRVHARSNLVSNLHFFLHQILKMDCSFLHSLHLQSKMTKHVQSYRGISTQQTDTFDQLQADGA